MKTQLRYLMFKMCIVAVRACLATANAWRSAARFFTAIAWGSARTADLVHEIQRRWDREPLFREEHVVTQGLMPWEEKLYDAELPAGGRIGLIGCGAGRDIIGLLRRGYTVDGVDLSAEMIEAARHYLAKEGSKAGLYCADICAFEFPEHLYDAFIFSNFTYVLIPGSARRINVLQKLRERLSRHGRIFLFYFNDQRRSDGRLVKTARWVARIAKNPESPEVGDEFSQYRDFHHHFTHEEIAHEAREAGFGIHLDCRIPEEKDGCAAVLSLHRSGEATIC